MSRIKISINVIFFSIQLFGQSPNIVWTKTYGGSDIDIGWQVEQTSDGGYIIVGENSSFGNGISDVWLLKTDENGDTLWTKRYGNSLWDQGYSVQQTSDEGYIITGTLTGPTGKDSDVLLLKTDSEGTILWSKTFGKDFVLNLGYSVIQTVEGGYIVVGTTQASSIGSGVYLIKTDQDGNLSWEKKYGAQILRSEGYSVQQTADSGYIITGWTELFGPNTAGNLWLVKTDPNGDSLWTRNYGGMDFDRGRSVKQTSDGGYIITGLYKGALSNARLWLLKTDSNGDTSWTKTFVNSTNGAHEGYSVQQTSDEGYIIAGTGSDDMWVIKCNSLGDTVWTKILGGMGSEAGNSVEQTKDGGYIITGHTTSNSAGFHDVLLVKISSEITDFDNDNEIISTNYQLQQNYPNPFNPSTTIKYSIPTKSNVILKVYDVLGREVSTLANELKAAGNYEIKFDASELTSGIYFYKLKSNNFVKSKKMLVLK